MRAEEVATMYRQILVPLDGSLLAERALPLATWLAARLGSRILLVRAVWVQTFPGADPTAAQVAAVQEAEAYLRGVAARLAERAIPTDIAVPYAPPAEGILLEAGLRGADLIVLSTHGRSGLGRWLYGSVAEAVLARSPLPVVLVRASAPEALWEREPWRARLLVPLDGSPLAEEALPHAVGLARALEATVVLVHAVPPPVLPLAEFSLAGAMALPDADPIEQARRAATAYLETVAARLAAQGVQTQTTVVEGAAATAILEVSRAVGAVLIVMATHGRTGLGRLLFGSVALEVLHRGDRPLLLVRPRAFLTPAAPVAEAGDTRG